MTLLNEIAKYFMPMLILGILTYGVIKKVDIYNTFIEGAREGFQLVMAIFPYMLAISVAVSLFTEGGGVHLLGEVLSPVLRWLRFPEELLPLLLTRPISGPAALGILGNTLGVHGADSLIGQIASTAMGSTDTTLYIVSVYYASVGIQKASYSIPVGLTADFMGFMGAVFICNYVF